jgi:hypothetical protein
MELTPATEPPWKRSTILLILVIGFAVAVELLVICRRKDESSTEEE